MTKEKTDCWTDPYYGRVCEQGEGGDRRRVEPPRRVGFWEALKMATVGPVFTRADIEAVDEEYIEG